MEHRVFGPREGAEEPMPDHMLFGEFDASFNLRSLRGYSDLASYVILMLW